MVQWVFTMNLFVRKARSNSGSAFLHVLIGAINQRAASVPAWFIPHRGELRPLGTPTLTAKANVSQTHAPRPCQQRLYINWSSLLSGQTHSLSLSHCLGPGTLWLLPIRTLIIVLSGGHNFPALHFFFMQTTFSSCEPSQHLFFYHVGRFQQNRDSTLFSVVEENMSNTSRRRPTHIRWQRQEWLMGNV